MFLKNQDFCARPGKFFRVVNLKAPPPYISNGAEQTSSSHKLCSSYPFSTSLAPFESQFKELSNGAKLVENE